MIVADQPPPPIPEYDQPPPPAPEYIWTPGYWAWNNDDYYWVPGVWVPPPQPGLLWTPSYWAFENGLYLFRRGYWGPRIGFYGGINYGYGYFGHGYEGGRWDGDRFYYNAVVNNLGPAPPPNVYRAPVTINNTVVNNVTTLNTIKNVNRTSFVGGPQGLRAAPTPQERQAASEQHLPPTAQQRQQARTAAVNPQQFLDANKGKPPVAATQRPAEFKAPGVAPARAPGGPIPQLGQNGQPPQPNGQPQKLPSEKPPASGQAGSVQQPPAPKEQTEKLPPGVRPPGADQPAPIQPPAGAPKSQERPVEPPIKTEPLNAPKAPAAIAPKVETPKVEAPKVEPPKSEPKSPAPQGMERPLAMPAMQERPRPDAGPRLEPGKSSGKPACGRPGEPPCPK